MNNQKIGAKKFGDVAMGFYKGFVKVTDGGSSYMIWSPIQRLNREDALSDAKKMLVE